VFGTFDNMTTLPDPLGPPWSVSRDDCRVIYGARR